MNVGEVIAQLSEQTVAKGSADVFCVDNDGGELFEILNVAWDEELNAHVIEMQIHE